MEKINKHLLIALGLFVLLSLLFLNTLSKINSLLKSTSSSENKSDFVLKKRTLQVAQIVVDVEGAVDKPGVYELEENSRLIDALKRCGGFSAQADKYTIARNFNLAKKLVDAEKIYVPYLGENPNLTYEETNSTLVNINTASQTELELLPSVGEKTAQKIIDNRPYLELNELETKKVLGPKTYLKIIDLITL